MITQSGEELKLVGGGEFFNLKDDTSKALAELTQTVENLGTQSFDPRFYDKIRTSTCSPCNR